MFCTGPAEQKARNLANEPRVAVTTGVDTWNRGTDVVVEGVAHRLTGGDRLAELADLYRRKYRGEWDFTARDDGFTHGGPDAELVYVFEVRPAKVLAFAKSPHGQTTFTFS